MKIWIYVQKKNILKEYEYDLGTTDTMYSAKQQNGYHAKSVAGLKWWEQ